MQKLTIGTRGSVLALWQANHIKSLLKAQYPKLEVELRIVKTKGDKILDVPLAKIGGKGLFTKELEMLLLNGSIDVAVHSLKDVPVELVEGLELVAMTRREDVRDSFLSFQYASLESLPKGARVGTTSLRRAMQINVLRNDLDCQSLRGNVQTRLQRLENGEFDAIILAQAGVNRLELKGIPYITPLDFMIPAMGQAALGIECRRDSECVGFLSFLNDKNAVFETHCERAFVRALNGGCQVPIGVNAQFENGNLKVRAILGLPDGSEVLREHLEAKVSDVKDCEDIGMGLAKSFLKQGAERILQKVQNWKF
ncbi:hydroxymethylbilane synthase [Helicobacter sp.]|uniref:hydroxymethylbilane synthase n=1 Tax=Helicobacter sp. TaxID=218 RepID=UPI0025C54551|nr:hydroxymethylbilane synthase [Helicobacter sp.]MCI5969489.1 hydroxymethylbilane synthase [Helicobacter sp.]MDY2584190.1 hydroxymethylbilane synthase [Helicobacter sp.]